MWAAAFLGDRGGLGGKGLKVPLQVCYEEDVSDATATCYSRSQASVGLGLSESSAGHASCAHKDAVPALPLRQPCHSLLLFTLFSP